MIEGRRALSGPKFYLRPHPRAKTFSAESPKNAQVLVRQLLNEVLSGRFPDSEKFVGLLAELGLVSLWFFLKCIAGAYGPYNELNESLHLEMANFRQSDFCMNPGAHAACFVPRGFFKSTIMTHGALAWELLRNPNLTALIANAIQDNAVDFKRNVMRAFDANPLIADLYPDFKQSPTAPLWNEKVMVLPNRTRYRTEANVTAIGAGGAGEGKHYDLVVLDDLVGLEDLDAEHMGNMDMEHKVQWFKTNTRALLRSQKRSRVLMSATRWSLDDPSALVCEDAHLFLGYTLEEFEEKPSGTWTVYNRMGIEDGEEVNPTVLTRESFSKQLDDDLWSAMTQSMNRPLKTGLAEFSALRAKPASLDWDEKEERYVIQQHGDANLRDTSDRVRLGDCDLVLGLDPAATDKGISSKTSRTALALWAEDSLGNYYLIAGKYGFFSITETYDHIFALEERYRGYIRSCIVEANAFQKILAPLLSREAFTRGVYLHFEPLPEGGDKDARIRSIVGTPLSKGKIWLCEGEGKVAFLTEQKLFPQAKYRKDFLDASAKAIAALRKPLSKEEEDMDRESWDSYMNATTRNAVTAY